jgi:hypothetical protein
MTFALNATLTSHPPCSYSVRPGAVYGYCVVTVGGHGDAPSAHGEFGAEDAPPLVDRSQATSLSAGHLARQRAPLQMLKEVQTVHHRRSIPMEILCWCRVYLYGADVPRRGGTPRPAEEFRLKVQRDRYPISQGGANA